MLVDRPPKKRETGANADVVRVFEAWRVATGHPSAILDRKRAARIAARLDDGFSTDDLILALQGWKNSPWHQGKDPNNSKVYDGTSTIFRDVEQVEKFIGLAGGRRLESGQRALSYREQQIAKVEAALAKPPAGGEHA